MFDQISNSVLAILSISVGGISLGSLLGMIVYVAYKLAKLKKENKITKATIETAFKDAVLPKNIKLDVSGKINEPIAAGLERIKTYLSYEIERIMEGEKLILAILSKFNHTAKLTDEEKAKLEEYLEKGATEEIKL